MAKILIIMLLGLLLQAEQLTCTIADDNGKVVSIVKIKTYSDKRIDVSYMKDNKIVATYKFRNGIHKDDVYTLEIFKLNKNNYEIYDKQSNYAETLKCKKNKESE